MIKPYFSIIIVSLNAEGTIASTLDSIRKQSYDNYEVIVKDGCSKDKTVCIAEKFAGERICIYVQPDKSVYDAMNQATELSRGKYVLYLNCGDCLYDDGVLADIYEFTKNLNGQEIVYGNYSRDGTEHYQKKKMSNFYIFRTPLCHQTMFWGKKILGNDKPYDIRYKILSDYDSTLRMYNRHVDFYHVNRTICCYLGGGLSEQEKNINIKDCEKKEIIKHYYNSVERFLYNFALALTLRRFRVWITSSNSPIVLKNIYYKVANALNK